MILHRRVCLCAAALWALTLHGTASAQTVINEARAMAGGITPGDAPGYPVTITRPGSYKLTSNLEVLDFDEPSEMILVTVPEVTIDLNGFSVTNLSWSFPNGIVSLADQTTVLNGNVYGFSTGLVLEAGSGHRVERVAAIFNLSDGMRVGPNSIVTMSISHGADNMGLVAGEGTVVVGNVLSDNDSAGLLAGAGSAAISNVFANNLNLDAEFQAPSAGYGSNVFSLEWVSTPVIGGTQLTPNLCAQRLCP